MTPPTLTRSELDKLKATVDLVALFESHGVAVRKIGRSLKAVSYTHLDVYKRQGVGRAGRFIAHCGRRALAGGCSGRRDGRLAGGGGRDRVGAALGLGRKCGWPALVDARLDGVRVGGVVLLSERLAASRRLATGYSVAVARGHRVSALAGAAGGRPRQPLSLIHI